MPLVRCPVCQGDKDKMPDCKRCNGSGTIWQNKLASPRPAIATRWRVFGLPVVR